MNAVKIELDRAERVAVEHYAEILGVTTEDVAYAALHRLMLRSDEPPVQLQIVELRDSRRHSRLPWGEVPAHPPATLDDEAEVPPLSRFL